MKHKCTIADKLVRERAQSQAYADQALREKKEKAHEPVREGKRGRKRASSRACRKEDCAQSRRRVFARLQTWASARAEECRQKSVRVQEDVGEQAYSTEAMRRQQRATADAFATKDMSIQQTAKATSMRAQDLARPKKRSLKRC
eukprot:292504-Pleurochrysis_carterae.AAC.3